MVGFGRVCKGLLFFPPSLLIFEVDLLLPINNPTSTMSKITGTVKWFSNRKGFGFLAPTSENSPTKEEVFVHHSSLVMVEGAYKTLVRGILQKGTLDFW
jgi:cold shock CspA family protein